MKYFAFSNQDFGYTTIDEIAYTYFIATMCMQFLYYGFRFVLAMIKMKSFEHLHSNCGKQSQVLLEIAFLRAMFNHSLLGDFRVLN